MGKAARRTQKHKEVNQKRKQIVAMEDFSHSDSTTNLNTQSESWECPPSTKKQFIPDTTTTSSRRASLRSWSRCSHPHISTEHSQQLHHLACQVLEGSLVVEPEMRNEETERVGNSIAQQTLMIMDGEAEKSLSKSNHSTQMELQKNTFEQEEEGQPLPEDIQASNKFEKIANKSHSKSISMVVGLPSSPSFSPKLTEIVDMLDDEDDDDDDGIDSANMDAGYGYKVRPEFIPILRKILTKHGDIAKNCTSLTMKDRSMLLELICGIISEMQEQQTFSKIKEEFLRSKIALLNDIKNTKVEVEWFIQGLVEMLGARQIIEQCGTLKENKENNRKTIEIAENKLQECEEMKRELSEKFKAICADEAVCRETLEKAMDECSRITETVKYVKSKVKRFLNCSPADALL